MQKLKVNSSDQNNKSCGIFHHEFKKLVSHFSGFFTILYGFYKKQESYFTIGVTLLQEGPWKESWFCNAAPGARWPVRLAKFWQARRGSWPRKDGGGSRGALGFDLMAWTGRRWLRRAARRRSEKAAAAAAVPARCGRGRG
jgi:hypothetical protein